MTAAAYIVGGPPDSPGRDELRYSLRSIEANAPDVTEAWVIGDVPDWFTGIRLPLEPQPEKFRNQRESITRFVNYPGAPPRFYLFNDDHFVTEHVAGQLPTCRNKNPASRWAQAEQDDGARLNGWHRTVQATAAWVADCTGTDPLIYESHTPLLFDTRRLKGYVNAYPIGQPFAVGELYPVAGAGGEGQHCGNAKVKAHDSLQAKLGNPMPYLSGNPDSWNGALGDYIRGLFPNPSRWER